jgi:D-alanine-D-alanine ligase-like ATP-grasp enzyme
VPYVEADLGFPVYIKPADGTQGVAVWRCHTSEEVRRTLSDYESRRVRIAIVEEAIDLPDYRIVVLHDEILSAYERVPLHVVGDGRSSILALLSDLQSQFEVSGRDTRLAPTDPRIDQTLARAGMNIDSVLPSGMRVRLLDVSNLSAGGTAIDMTDAVAAPWRQLAVNVARLFGLAYCGIDLACRDISASHDEYAIIEVNAAPGLDHYASVGARQEELVHEMYAAVFDEAPLDEATRLR